MKLIVYPYLRNYYKVNLATDDLVSKLNGTIVSVDFPEYDLYAPDKEGNLFGSVDEDGFTIYRTRLLNDRPISVVKGVIILRSDNDACILKVTHKLNFFTSLFFIIWNFVCLFMMCFVLFGSDKFNFGFLYPLFFLLVFNKIIIAAFKSDVRYFVNYLANTIGARKYNEGDFKAVKVGIS